MERTFGRGEFVRGQAAEFGEHWRPGGFDVVENSVFCWPLGVLPQLWFEHVGVLTTKVSESIRRVGDVEGEVLRGSGDGCGCQGDGVDEPAIGDIDE